MDPALESMQALCERTWELQPLCELMLGRVVALCGYTTHFRRRGASDGDADSNAVTPPAAEAEMQWAAKVDSTVARFTQLLERQVAANSAIFRLAIAPEPVRELRALHMELDGIFRGMRAEHVDPSAGWTSEWERSLEQSEQALQLAARLEVVAANAKSATESEQRESLAVVKFAFQRAQKAATQRSAQRRRSRSTGRTKSGSSSGNSIQQVIDAQEEDELEIFPDHEEWLRVLFRKLVRVSSVEVPVLPAWFFSPAELTFHQSSLFRAGPHTEVVNASWMPTQGQQNQEVRQLVIKRLVLDCPEEAGVVAMLEREARLLHTVPRHPHLLKLVGACTFGVQPFLAFESPWSLSSEAEEVAVAVSLEDYLGLSVDHRRHVFRLLAQTASGLQKLHEASLAHGDLRCANVLVGDDGQAQLANMRGFSLVQCSSESDAADADPEALQDAKAEGSMRWKAPELLSSEISTAPDQASDIYALGMTLLEALSGDLPWGFLADSEVREHVLRGELPSPPPGVDESVWSLLEAMCDSDRAARPDITTVVEELQALADEERERDGGSTEAEDMAPPLPLPVTRVPTIAGGADYSRNTISSFAFSSQKEATSPFNNKEGARRRSGTTGSEAMRLGSTMQVPSRPRSATQLQESQPNEPRPQESLPEESFSTAVATVELKQKWLGVKINSIGNRVVVSKFLRSDSGAQGEIEASGRVIRGDVIVAVNGQSVRGLDRLQIGAFVQSTPRPLQLSFERDPMLLTESFRFRGLSMDPRWRDRGLALPLPGPLDRLLTGGGRESFSIEFWFSLSELDGTFLGGVLLGAQDLPFQETGEGDGWSYVHRQLLIVDAMGNLWCSFLERGAPVCVARDLMSSHWYHLVVTFGPGAGQESFSATSVHEQPEQLLTVYLDGEQRFADPGCLLQDWSRLLHVNVGSGCISGPTPAKPEPQFSGWFGFSGLVFDVCVWPRLALSDLQIQLLFRGGGDLVDAPGYSLRRDMLGDNDAGHQPSSRGSMPRFDEDSQQRRRKQGDSACARSSRLQGPSFAEVVRTTWPHQVGAQVYS